MADLGLGLATAPVLFASQEFPQLERLISRRFSSPGDVETAWSLVNKSDGLSKTRALADQYRIAAEKSIEVITNSRYKQGLILLAEKMVNRQK